MHTSFTGNSRKTRQVNLSGRGPVTPWANLSQQSTTAKNAGKTQDALANAQASRLQRQVERQKVTSARIVQRLWRGHYTRRYTKQQWRAQWDSVEEERSRNDLPMSIRYEEAATNDQSEAAAPYESIDVCHLQMKLLVHFLDVKERLDRMRLLYFGDALRRTLSTQSAMDDLLLLLRESPWIATSFYRLGQQAAACIGAMDVTRDRREGVDKLNDEITARYICLLSLLGKILPKTLSRDANIYFSMLSDHLSTRNLGQMTQNAVMDLILAILDSRHPESRLAYRAFARFLSSEAPSKIPGMLEGLGKMTDQVKLATALEQESRKENSGGTQADLSADSRLWRLAYFVYLHNRKDRKSPLSASGRENVGVQALASLLSSCASEIAERWNLQDEEMEDLIIPPTSRRSPLPTFIRQNLESLAREASVAEVMSGFGSITGSDAFVARNLSNYAVALLRAFPDKAGDIRMWLYQGSVRSTTKSNTSTIQYFWNAAQLSTVFKGIYQTQRSVLSLLKEPAAPHNQIGRPQYTPEDLESWRDEWQMILLFLELYTFILKPMDDEEFFSLSETGNNESSSKRSPYSHRGVLPLADITKLTIFLKNLAFTLYWHASDLANSNQFEDDGGISALFGNYTPEVHKAPERSKPQSLAGIDGVSQVYLKGLVTGLLRMLHERDSRRKFLPDKHWLMTSQVEMNGFISAVVAEEEKRQELGDGIQEEEDDLDEILKADGDNSRTAAIDIPQGPFTRQPNTSASTWNPRHGPNDARTFQEAMQRKRAITRRIMQLASLAPRLEILRNLPFFIPFETRVQIFREFVKHDQIRRREGHIDPDTWRMHTAMGMQRRGLLSDTAFNTIAQHRAEVHREHIFENAFDSFYGLGEGLKEPIQISFIDRFGNPEAGIDGGGVTKEFLTSITNEAFDPKSEMAMFTENDQHELYPNPTMIESTIESLRRMGVPQGSREMHETIREVLKRYEFLGRVLGKCMYEGILVDINFAGFFLLKWALTGGTTSASNETAYRASINDVRDFDGELYQGLVQLKNYPGDVEADLSLNFSVTDEVELKIADGSTVKYSVTKDLVPNGSNIAVTNINRPFYIAQIARHRLQTQPALVTNAFLKGLGQIIQPMWMAMFNQKELQTLVGGENSELDIADLRRNTQYNGLYQIGDDGLEHPTIALFWKVMREMSDEDRRKILKFVTSTPRAPLLGFSHLSPPFTIHSTSASEGTERLPSTSTCVNLLKLPNYRNERTMREKLLYAANSGAGFDLS